MKYLIVIVLLLAGCSMEQIYEKHPDQAKNIKNAPSFHNACAYGEYGEWSKGFMCSRLSK